LVASIIAFACEFVAARKMQNKQQQEVIEIDEICARKDEKCIIEDLENNSAATAEHQMTFKITEIDQLNRIMQKGDKEDLKAGRNMTTIAAEVHSHDESNIQGTSQLNVN